MKIKLQSDMVVSEVELTIDYTNKSTVLSQVSEIVDSILNLESTLHGRLSVAKPGEDTKEEPVKRYYITSKDKYFAYDPDDCWIELVMNEYNLSDRGLDEISAFFATAYPGITDGTAKSWIKRMQYSGEEVAVSDPKYFVAGTTIKRLLWADNYFRIYTKGKHQ